MLVLEQKPNLRFRVHGLLSDPSWSLHSLLLHTYSSIQWILNLIYIGTLSRRDGRVPSSPMRTQGGKKHCWEVEDMVWRCSWPPGGHSNQQSTLLQKSSTFLLTEELSLPSSPGEREEPLSSGSQLWLSRWGKHFAEAWVNWSKLGF